MSATSQLNQIHLESRSQYMKPGVRKAAKATLSRSRRVKEKHVIDSEVLDLNSVSTSLKLELHELSQADLDAYADALLRDSQPAPIVDDGFFFDDESEAQANDEATLEIPLVLAGSLPDWMILELEAANGDSFALLSLFEAKRPSPKAAISMDDEPLYA